MDSATRERIFEPFFTTKKVGEGAGLGLSVVHGIITSHEGAITVESEPGRGTAFQIYLPLAQGECLEIEAAEEPATQGQEHILLVDDDQDVLELGKRMLGRSGYRIASCTDGAEAWELFREDPEGYDLVVTDQSMPRWNGTQLAAKVRRLRPDVPVIVLTGFGEVGVSEACRTLGLREPLTKPITARELCAAVREALKGSGEEAA
jgi:CheY-like chemotaxis protein